uniref:Small ribosomal subunit protein uS2 n=1 Tax=Rhodosorus marinus TaxID=101924 RepID=A0A7S2ZZV0_9RHOD|mmetsp:Transcript_39315/g.155963  ORF Transcript_39315/g.155963 Transcript_39315/m.155963 type:complete len:289 (+) Transcript_39315:219-1085(+)
MTAILQTKNEDIEKMLIASTHNGTKNCEVLVEPYVWRTRTDDGTNIINLEKTWEKLQLAARIIAAIENPQDIIAFSKREYGHRAVLKFAEYTGARCEAGRWTPGQLTNQICQKYSEPRLLIVNDPLVDCNPIREASYVGIPVIAFVDTDSPLQYVDVAIPGNTRTQYSIPLLWYLLTREVKYLRGEIPRGRPWEVMVDLFFYRNPKELDKQEVPVATAPQVRNRSYWQIAQLVADTLMLVLRVYQRKRMMRVALRLLRTELEIRKSSKELLTGALVATPMPDGMTLYP